MDRSHLPTPGPSKEELGLHLRGLRLALGWTTAELAERAGVEVDVLEEVELGRNAVEITTLTALARGLGMHTSTVLRLWERRVVIEAPKLD